MTSRVPTPWAGSIFGLSLVGQMLHKAASFYFRQTSETFYNGTRTLVTEES